jgi:hypothetical protein
VGTGWHGQLLAKEFSAGLAARSLRYDCVARLKAWRLLRHCTPQPPVSAVRRPDPLTSRFVQWSSIPIVSAFWQKLLSICDVVPNLETFDAVFDNRRELLRRLLRYLHRRSGRAIDPQQRDRAPAAPDGFWASAICAGVMRLAMLSPCAAASVVHDRSPAWYGGEPIYLRGSSPFSRFVCSLR